MRNIKGEFNRNGSCAEVVALRFYWEARRTDSAAKSALEFEQLHCVAAANFHSFRFRREIEDVVKLR